MPERYRIRNANWQDLDKLSQIEAACFPAAEAATKETLAQRLQIYSKHFLILELNDGTIIGFIDGFVTNQAAITDEMFEQPHLHDESAAYQAVFGLNVLPDYRGNHYGIALMNRLIADACAAGRKGCILTCKENMISYYEKFGYQNQGVSQSEHGGAVWYDMLLEF